VRGGSCASGEWRHCNTSEREGRGVEGERYAPSTFLGRQARPRAHEVEEPSPQATDGDHQEEPA